MTPADSLGLRGMLSLPTQAQGIVVFAHGSGRLSRRNTFVARSLQNAGMATLLIDLLHDKEAQDRTRTFDTGFLADRLLAVTHWLSKQPETRALKLGYFGAGTGAGAALQAAARQPQKITAIVSRGGRLDLAMAYLHRVQAPTLLIVGENDTSTLPFNETAYFQLQCSKRLVVVPGATHHFDEPGALDKVAQLAREWFLKHFLPQA